MSRNLSLKKIAPYLRSYSVRRSDQTIPSSFDKHFVHKKKKTSDQEDSDSREDQEKNFAHSKETEDGNLPEIFKLIENPDFYELFELSNGKKENIIMLIVKKIRQERGVSSRLPISYIHALKLNRNEIYRQSHEWYHNHQNSSVFFSM